MDDKKMEKYAALGGIAFVVLNIIGMIPVGSPPKSDDSNAVILKWFVDKESGIKLAAFLGALSVIALIWWMGSLWRRMAAAEGGSPRLAVASVIGFTASGVAWLLSAGLQSAVAMRSADLGEAAGFFYVLSGVMMGVAGAFVAAHLLATNLLALRTKMFPTWHAGIGLLAGLGMIGGAVGTMTDSGAIMAIGLISFLLWALWILLTSVHMWRTAG
jgi:hypothetical protein